MLYHVTLAGRTLRVEVDEDGVRVEGERVEADLQAVSDGPLRSLLLDGASWRLVTRAAGKRRWEVRIGGHLIPVEVVDERARRILEMTGAGAGPTGPRRVRAPMPGLVVRVEVQEGDEVRPGQGLVIVEAMKMENELRAESAARVSAVRVTRGETVEKDQVLVELSPLDETEG